MISIFDIVSIPNLNKDVTEPLKRGLRIAVEKRLQVHIPTGQYLISDNILDVGPTEKASITGDGVAFTRFVLTQPIANGLPVFKLTGNSPDDPLGHSSWHNFDGFNCWSNDGIPSPWFHFNFVAHVYCSRVAVGNVDGTAVIGTSFWDAAFSECHFARSGNLDRQQPVFLLEAATNPKNESDSRCNNIAFLNSTRFENNRYTGLHFGRKSVKNRVIGVKFDRCYHSIVMEDSNHNVIMGSHSTLADQTGFFIKNSFGNVINSCMIDGSGHHGVCMWNCKKNVITHNVFGLQKANKNNLFLDDASHNGGNLIFNMG